MTPSPTKDAAALIIGKLFAYGLSDALGYHYVKLTLPTICVLYKATRLALTRYVPIAYLAQS
jgi:hypothetical protein